MASSYIGSASLEEWYNRKLTSEQRALVDKDLTQPVRLRGAAGTGKTVALVVKCVREALKHSHIDPPFRIAFITHSHALAHDVVRSMIDTLDQRVGRTGGDVAHVWLGSLYELAQHIMQYERKGLQPLSTDGREGREFQGLLIADAIRDLERDAKFVLGDMRACSEDFRRWLAPEMRERLIVELMNEFATSIDADNVRLGNAAAEKYINQKRDEWQLSLPTPIDRRVILDIHNRYCETLESSSVLSMDQMISDFNRYLETHEWRQLKQSTGYDLIFVDELHYFNKIERMTFHSLFRLQAIINGRCPLFMAYDLKQSINDTMINYSGGDTSNLFNGMKVGESDIVELTKIFRSTPEIADFLQSLDGAFPALGLGADWARYPVDTNAGEGDAPRIVSLERETQAIDRAFSDAREDARNYGGRSVAVLCTDEDAFDKYIKMGRISGKFELIAGRDQLNRIRYAGVRPIFSTPDYVAGLQFSSVYLLNVEGYQESIVDRSLSERRRFVSRVYVGASRASDKLTIVTSKEKGGPAELLNGPISAGRVSLVG